MKEFSISDRIKSFKHAFNGIRTIIFEEHNLRIHILVALLVVIFGFLVNLSIFEWLVLLLTITFVITLEIVNSAIENLADIISPEWNLKIKKVKDTCAAAVLVAGLISIVIGALIFIPKFFGV